MLDENGEIISIHAPTRGATHFGRKCNQHQEFQSTLPQGERRHKREVIKCQKKFQSTLPQGERHIWILKYIIVSNFNPRSHKGSDRLRAVLHGQKRDFNPRSHKGSDNNTWAVSDAVAISIHAPTRGATLFSGTVQNLTPYFNPRSHKGSDHETAEFVAKQTDFNPRSHKGSDVAD